jgi:hypothetical protein
MVPGRSWWWVKKDVDRLLARAEHSSGGPATDAELAYMHGWCVLLLAEVLPLDEYDRARVEELQRAVTAALAVVTNTAGMP